MRDTDLMPADDPLPLPLPEPRGLRPVRCRGGCRHVLTDPVSRRRGWGPTCWRKLGENTAPRPGRFEVEQDTIPGA